MAAHLEACPSARAVVNFSPVVLDQLAAYGKETGDCVRDRQSALSDPLLAVLEGRKSPQEFGKRALAEACLRANQTHLIERFPGVSALANLARAALQQTQTGAIQYLDDQFFTDLVVWYHLAWLGESVRHGDPRIQELMEKGQGFSGEDRWVLFTVIAELLASLIGRYRALANQGRIELSMSPYCHPILPLLLDFAVARESIPDAKLPESPSYPGGEARARWHLTEGQRVFHSYFERDPAGCWPSEGAISDAAVRLLDAQGFHWCASGQLVLHNSLGNAQTGGGPWHHPWRLPGTQMACFFRDVELSNLIGFSYKDWRAEDAVNDLMQRLEVIASQADGAAGRVVAIILDGENPWEYFPHNGYEFLTRLYSSFAEHPH
ncbi:MAG: glycoside hydrolase, partial [Gammaproteobacteria bacterium]